MSIMQKNLWRITCDRCGAEDTIETFMDFSPTGSDLIKHGFIKVIDLPAVGYGQREEHHYCEQCAHALMSDEKGEWK